MKIECSTCGEIYDNRMSSFCSQGHTKGGYCQEPRLKRVGKLDVHLKDTLVHTKSFNEFQIKEIQDKGIIVVITKAILPQLMGKVTYVSNLTINEYEVRK